jgi:hypothetical protein
MLISANIGRVSWENRTRFINRNVFLECVHSEIIFFAVVVRTSKSRSIWYETLKLKSVKSTMRTGVVSFLLIGGIFCVNLILSDAAEIVDVRSNIF